jgi:hypothetical protein
MAEYRIRSTDGNNSDNGSSWPLAKLDLAGFAAVDAAGDTCYVSQNHAESTATSVVLSFAGTASAPTKIICVNDSADPPISDATSATLTITGNAVSWQFSGNLYVYGLNIINGGTGNSGIWMHNGVREKQLWEKCTLQLTAGTGGIFVNAGSSVQGEIEWKEMGVRFGSTSSLGIQTNGDHFRWVGGSVLSGSPTPVALINPGTARQAEIELRNLDLSNLSSGFYLVTAGSTSHVVACDCKLPASWTGDLHNGAMTAGARIEMWNCDSGNTKYRLRVREFSGELRDETTLVRAADAGDWADGTELSWKIATTSSANFHVGRFRSPTLHYINDVVGSAITLSVDILRDSAAGLTNEDIWLEARYPGSSDTPLGSSVSGARGIVASPAAHPSSSSTWTATGMSNPNKQRLELTMTPQQAGLIYVEIVSAKGSMTVYAEPIVRSV